MVITELETFKPDEDITRGEFAYYLARGMGMYRKDDVNENPFSDVIARSEQGIAILSLKSFGILSGYDDGTFRPDALITREEAMTLFNKAMLYTALESDDAMRYQTFTDFDTVSDWASAYVKDVLAAHIFNDTSSTTLAPKANLTHAETIQGLYNMLVSANMINE